MMMMMAAMFHLWSNLMKYDKRRQIFLKCENESTIFPVSLEMTQSYLWSGMNLKPNRCSKREPY